MTKEEKQIIDRATKEIWRTGDRTRLKHLLEKNLKLYCENEQLKEQVSDIKANCDLAIEGRDVKIKKLEEENVGLKERYKRLKKRYDKVDIIGYDALKNLTKAKEIIKNCIHILKHSGTALDWKTVINQAEQFLKEIEK